MRAPWEYKISTWKLGWKGFDYATIERDMNEMGRQGWEVISTVAPSYGAGQAIEFAVVARRQPGASTP